ncbi:hypothetical protein [Flavobacterium salmonis]|uniref:Uncharacterized protein n=1 Tax=Flavobacterium salmonis TaxID=2654844 RepID=A0A6V6ZDY3_9FLAO|nr:hypothetical protein [Flavobacterium salmonis]CAD0009634.1 hypothetical protein FLAT13_05046 [Flavobacterium salmonis]
MITFSLLIIIFGITSIVLYAVKNNKNPNENRTILRSYDFSKGKNEINTINNYENKEHFILDYQYNYEVIAIHFDEYNKKTYQLTSRDYSLYLKLYDRELNFLNEIDLKLDHSPEFTKDVVIETFREDDEDYTIIVLINADSINYYHFDADGIKIYKKYFSVTNNETYLIYHRENEFIPILDEYYNYKPINIFWKKDEVSFEVLLSDDLIYPEKEWCGYEYIESVTKTNITNQFAFITHHANYGVQGVKIFKINHSKTIDLIYDMDDLDFNGAFHHLSFNSKGDRFVVLLYTNDKFYNDSFSILEYSVLDNKKPIRIIKTKYAYWEFGTLHTRYLTDRLVCVIRNSDIIVYDLEFEKLKQRLKRDVNSAFYVGNGILMYQDDNEVIVLSF